MAALMIAVRVGEDDGPLLTNGLNPVAGRYDLGHLFIDAPLYPILHVEFGLGLDAAWFSLDPDAPKVLAARDAGRLVGFLQDGALWLQQGDMPHRIVAVADVPIAMGGAARYNLSNALAAACLAHVLGVDTAAIASALVAFHSDPKDNPGRLNEFAHNGARLFVDFAHNPHSIAAVTGALAALPAKRRFVMLAHAGDRSDDDIRGLARGACAFGPDWVMLTELPGYLRGRAPGDIPALLHAECLAQGIPADRILQAVSPSEGVAAIIGLVQPGDLALLLVHSERDEVFRMLGAWDGPARHPDQTGDHSTSWARGGGGGGDRTVVEPSPL